MHLLYHVNGYKVLYALCIYFTYIGDTNLPGKYDILRIDLNPKDEYKSVNYSY